MNEPIIRLENWSVVEKPTDDPYRPPETLPTILAGNVYNHPRLENGVKVLTSKIIEMSVKNGFAKTHNTDYILGDPDPEFLEWVYKSGHKIEDYELPSLS